MLDNRHLGIESSLNFHQADTEIINKGSYRVVRTKSRPHFFWGNYLIFSESPSETNYENWIEKYNSEFNSEEQGFITITWSSSELGNPKIFLKNGFEIETQEVLRLNKLIIPEKLNPHVQVRIINKEDEWNQLKKTQWIKNWPLKQPQEQFLENKILTYRRLQDQGFGFRYGAFIDDDLVGDLGIYYRNKIARFNNVFTHHQHYNKGICRTLVYKSVQLSIENNLADEFVMQATETEYAKTIYKKIGFELYGKSHDMTWISEKWKKDVK